MQCSLCNGVALWQVGKKGYCRAHKLEAWAAEAEVNRRRHKAKVQDEKLDKRGFGEMVWDAGPSLN